MLEKTSVCMMVLLVAASLIGIAGIYQYEEGQVLPAATSQPEKQVQKANYATGKVNRVVNYASSVDKACIAVVQVPSGQPNNLGIEPGGLIALLAPNESFCTLFGLSKIGNTQILFYAQKVTASSLPPAIQADPVIQWKNYDVYRITRVDM
ncbi:MAG TPA: hypothetical protein VFS97_08165 [Nitrososphaeraceae archaeon]|nr:hypothetical protein [Nitrososphaeraceae archaeon]